MTGKDIGAVYGGLGASMSSIGNYVNQALGIAEKNSALSQSYAEREMDFNSLEAAKNRDWQEYMSNTAHQREVADLQAAGLNPVLSASGGNGAPVTSGATASGSSGSVDTAGTAAMVSLLNNAINADVQLQGQKTSALASLGVAQKQAESAAAVQALANSQSFKNAVLASDTSKAINAINAAVSTQNSKRSYNASVYGSNKSFAAAIESVQKQLDYNAEHPSNMWQALTSNDMKDIIGMLTGDKTKGTTYGNFIDTIFNFLEDADIDANGPNTKNTTFHFSDDPVADALKWANK